MAVKDGFALIFALECGTLRRRESNHETIYLLDRCNAVLMMCSGVCADLRYPSEYYPDFIGAGMVCADFAIEQKARRAVFLHLNAVGRGWNTTPPRGLIMCGDKHGRALGESVCRALENHLYDKPGGMPNAGKGADMMIRKGKHQMGAGWLNACDAAGISAIVTETVYVNNRGHAQFLRSEAGARMLAETIAQGVIDWLKTQPHSAR